VFAVVVGLILIVALALGVLLIIAVPYLRYSAAEQASGSRRPVAEPSQASAPSPAQERHLSA
jgi:hypothetical protein